MQSKDIKDLKNKSAEIVESVGSLDESSKSYIKGFLAGARAASQTQKEEQHAKEETKASGSSR